MVKDNLTIKEKVENLLKRKDEIGFLCRNNDNFLTLCYINVYHQGLNIVFNEYVDKVDLAYWSKNLPSLSEIKRIRAQFQNVRGLYLAETKTLDEREKKAKAKREEYLN